MGLGSETPRRKTYYLSPRSMREVDNKKIVDPHFKVTLYDENSKKTVLGDERSVSGYLVSIGHGQYEYPKNSGDMIPTIQLTMVDGDSLYKIEANINSNMIRGLMNTITGTQKFETIKISLYTKNEQPNLYVSNNDGQCKWRFDYKSELAPLVQEVPDPQKPNKKIKVYHAVNELLMKAWLETEPIVAAHAKEMGYTAQVTAAPKANLPQTQSSTQHLSQEQQNAVNNVHQSDFDPGEEPFNTAPDDDLPF